MAYSIDIDLVVTQLVGLTKKVYSFKSVQNVKLYTRKSCKKIISALKLKFYGLLNWHKLNDISQLLSAFGKGVFLKSV